MGKAEAASMSSPNAGAGACNYLDWFSAAVWTGAVLKLIYHSW